MSLSYSPCFFTSPKFATPSPSPSRNSASFRRISATYAATAERKTHIAPVSSTTSLYEVLGIQIGADSLEIKAAYRKLARVLHPDVANNSSADEFMRIHAAYATLSDPGKRADYDRTLFRRQRSSATVRFSGYSGRSWETDQCW